MMSSEDTNQKSDKALLTFYAYFFGSGICNTKE